MFDRGVGIIVDNVSSNGYTSLALTNNILRYQDENLKIYIYNVSVFFKENFVIDKKTLIKHIQGKIDDLESRMNPEKGKSSVASWEYYQGRIISLQYLKYDIEAGRVDG